MSYYIHVAPALSKDAMMKMGLSTRQVLTKEEAAAKVNLLCDTCPSHCFFTHMAWYNYLQKRSIDALLKTTANKEEETQKKQRYVYL